MNEAEREGRRLPAAARDVADADFARAAELRNERARLLDRLRVMVDEAEAKGADVTGFRNDISAVSGLSQTDVGVRTDVRGRLA